jgi:putative transcriptional regulator
MFDMTIKNKLRLLIADKEYRENRKISYRTVAQEADIPLSVLTDYTSQKVKRFDVKTLEKLCRYFDCQPGDLLEYVPDEEEPKNKKAAR